MARDRIYLSPPHMCGEELKYVHEAFETNWIAPVGPHIKRFEDSLCNYVGVRHCAALSTGTAAIHLALIVLGVGQGDEVICQSFTFSGSCNPIVYQGAIPVFVDSEHETWNLDPMLLREAIQDRIKRTGRRPKAIIVVHLYGMPARMDEIMSVAREFEIPVIEDAAEALGSEYKGKKCGSIGDLGILSFNGNKIITTSGGGALLSNNEKWVQSARFLATQAREQVSHYEHKEIGYNYRLSNVSAAIGLGQLTVLGERVMKRRQNFDRYRAELMVLPGISFQKEPEGHVSNRWLTALLLDDQRLPDRIRVALENENIESRPLWKPMHLQPVFEGYPSYGSGISSDLFKSGICLPSGTSLTGDQLIVISGYLKIAVTS